MLEQLIHLLGANQLAAPALIASIIGPIAYSLPSRVTGACSWIANKLTYEAAFHFSDAVFSDLSVWLDRNQSDIRFVRNEKVESSKARMDWDKAGTTSNHKWRYSPGYGTFLLKSKGHPFMLLQRTRESEKSLKSLMPPDILTLKAPVWSKRSVRRFVEYVSQIRHKEQRTCVYLYDCGSFSELKQVESEISGDLLSPEFKRVEQLLVQWRDSKDAYERRGLKHKLGILLHSSPGMGKSTFVAYLAKRYSMNLYYLRALDIHEDLLRSMAQIPHGSLILLEDMDAMCIGKRKLSKPKPDDTEEDREADEKESRGSKITLGELLNVMDGVLGYTGSVLIATTNDISALDPALIRPGRIDLTVEIKPLAGDLIARHWQHFHQIEGEYRSSRTMSIAEMQAILLRHINDSEAARIELGIEATKPTKGG